MIQSCSECGRRHDAGAKGWTQVVTSWAPMPEQPGDDGEPGQVLVDHLCPLCSATLKEILQEPKDAQAYA